MATRARTRVKRAAGRKSVRARSGSRGSRAGSASPGAMNALDLLKHDHREVEGFFEEYEELEDEEEKGALAEKICTALKVHCQIEEEIFYPQARTATEDGDLLDEALVEHAGAKHLIAEIEAMKPGDDLYDAKVKVLGEQVKQHVKEEEKELFREAKSAKMDLAAIGQRLAERKEELMSEMAPGAGLRQGHGEAPSRGAHRRIV